MTVSTRLSRPTEQEAIASIADLVGTDNAEMLWQRACRQFAGAQPEQHLDDLYRICEHMAAWPGLVGIAARSMTLRIEVYLERASQVSEGA